MNFLKKLGAGPALLAIALVGYGTMGARADTTAIGLYVSESNEIPDINAGYASADLGGI